MGLYKDRGRWYFVKRVPKRFAHVDSRQKVTRALWTDSKHEAAAKAPAIEAELLAYWEALVAGRGNDANAAYDAAKRLAAARGFVYRPASEILAGPTDEILNRLLRLIEKNGEEASLIEARALLGSVPEPGVVVSTAFDDFCNFVATDRLASKSEAQKKRWRNTRDWAVKCFIETCGDKDMGELTRQDGLSFRDSLAAKIDRKEISRNTANKQIGILSNFFTAWSERYQKEIPNPFSKLHFKEPSKKTKGQPFSSDFIRDQLLKPGALDGLNDEARDVLLVMVNTGARPSEILGARFNVSGDLPHMDIFVSDERELKRDSTARDIPLLGVSLEAAKRIVSRGGITRYHDKSSSWSAVVNKYMTENGLRETPDHTAYSLRHSFEDRMLEAGVDDRIRAELMGHKYARPDYGRGGSLEIRRKALEPISF